MLKLLVSMVSRSTEQMDTYWINSCETVQTVEPINMAVVYRIECVFLLKSLKPL